MNHQQLSVSLFGGIQIVQTSVDSGTDLGDVVSGFASRKAEALLAYLVCNPRPRPRETLAALLWPNNDQNRALANLSVALSSLRKQLAPYLLIERHTIAFNQTAAYTLDVTEFELAITQARTQQKKRDKLTRTAAAQLSTAVSHYTGDFLLGFNIRGAADFEAWMLLEQERLRQMMVNALADLAAFHLGRGGYEQGIAYGRQLVDLDPLLEEAHRQLMQHFALNGQRAQALAQYEQCVQFLEEELGVEPDESTTALYEQISAGAFGQYATLTAHSISASASNNIPVQANSFIGRETELTYIEAWLADPNGRLLTITGPGGIGKTRLALEAARAHLGQFADGVWHISLIPVSDTNGLVNAIANSIGLTFSGSAGVETQLLKQLKTMELLLLLDNFEHLLTPSLLDFLTSLTRQAADVRLLVTSRERLRLQVERLLELRGLPYPMNGDQGTGDHIPISDFPSVVLFQNRSQRIKPDFDLRGQETAVITLCQMVAGLPLALELAATWSRVLSVAEIAAEIEKGLDLLVTTLHDVPDRHRSLRSVINYSWRLLDQEERLLFTKLAVFHGGFLREAAEDVAGAKLPKIMALVDKSFMRLDEDGRYRRHPLLIQFSSEQLTRNRDLQAVVQGAHAQFYSRFLEQQHDRLRGEENKTSLAGIAADMENVRAAWNWALAAADYDLLAPMIKVISRFFADRSRYLEGTEFFTMAVETLLLRLAARKRDAILATMQSELGFFLYQNGRYADAQDVLDKALNLARSRQLEEIIPDILNRLSEVIGDQGDPQQERIYLEEALAYSRAGDDAERTLVILNNLGNNYTDRGDYTQAQSHFEEAMAIAQSLGNVLRIGFTYNNMAIIANRQGDYREAIRLWQAARRHFMELSHDWGLAVTSHNIGMAYSGLESYDEALENIQQAYAAHEKIGHKRGMIGGLAVQGVIYRNQGKHRKARRYFNEALLLSQEVGSQWLATMTIVEVAKLEIEIGNFQQAVMLLSFAQQHPALPLDSKSSVEQLLDELRAELPLAIIANGQTIAAAHTIDSLIAELLQ